MLKGKKIILGITGSIAAYKAAILARLMVKEGAEGVEIAALADGRSVAFKVIDGSMRAIPVVLIAALSRIGVDVSALHELAHTPVLGGGLQVGEIIAVIG